VSRVLSLSLANGLYERVTEHAASQGLTVYQYVRRAIEMRASDDDHIQYMLSQYDEPRDR
jgi:predicted DNA-binding protein